jgi:hypothetical protein
MIKALVDPMVDLEMLKGRSQVHERWGSWGSSVDCLGRVRHTDRPDLCVSRDMMLRRAATRHYHTHLTGAQMLPLPSAWLSKEAGKEAQMKRVLLTAIVLLAAANLPLAAETPGGPVQGAVQGTVKGTATVGQGVVQGAGQAGQGIAQGSANIARGAGQATVGVARGAGTVAAKTGRGTWCIITLGYGC